MRGSEVQPNPSIKLTASYLNRNCMANQSAIKANWSAIKANQSEH